MAEDTGLRCFLTSWNVNIKSTFYEETLISWK